MTMRTTARAIARTIARTVGFSATLLGTTLLSTSVLGTQVASATPTPTPAPPTITAGPSGTTTAIVRTATFTYSSATNMNFKCSLDSAAPASYVVCPAAAGRTGTISYIGLADGSHTFRVLAQVGAAQSAPTIRTWSIDATRPTVVSISRLDPPSVTAAFGTVRWLVSFSEPVANVGLANFSLAATGLGGSPALLSITPNAGSSTAYIVSATSGPGTSSSNPTLRLDLSNTGTIRDVAGNNLNGTFTGATYMFIATSVPAFISVTMINGSTTVNGSTIVFPLTTNVQVSSIGGSCAMLPGSNATVSVSITGPTNRTGTAPCTSGTWAFALSPVLRNSPPGIDDGNYTVTATQGNGSNVVTTGPRVLTLATRSFTVSGNAVSPLRPGSVSDLNLTITNPYSFALKIESLTVSFTGTASCNGPANFAVARAFAGPVTVPAGSTVLSAAVAPQIRMLNLPTAQDSCKSTPIALNYSGMASRA